MNGRRGMKRAMRVFVVGVALGSCADPRTEVPLHPEPAGEEPPLFGISNLFFEPADEVLGGRAPRIRDSWGATEVADLYGRGTGRPVYVLRYRDVADSMVHVVDTDADLDFVEEAPLEFRRSGAMRIADVGLHLAPPGSEAKTEPEDPRGAEGPIPYQVVQAEGYTYGRVARGHRGRITVDGEPVGIVLRPRSRNRPFYGLDEPPRVYADLNDDGVVDQSPSTSREGRPVAAEEVDAREPFFVRGEAFRITEIDPLGTHLVVERMDPQAGAFAAPGFEAPDLSGTTLDGRSVDLSELQGRTVLLEFWSTSCGFSEEARPGLNALADDLGDDLVWLAVARETNSDSVAAFQDEHPRRGTVVIADRAAWAAFNPELATPTFYVVDPDGRVRLQDRGSGAVPRIRARLEEGR